MAAAWTMLQAGRCIAMEPWFSDIERYTSLRDTRIDVAGPEPASFTALGVSPFVTAQALASSDVAFSVAQVFDDYGNPRAALGFDFAPFAVTDPDTTLGEYQTSHRQRVASRMQLSVAVSKGESAADESTRVAPTLRIVFHEQRDPRVHRGPGSLQHCFEQRVTPPEAVRHQLLDVAERLREAQALLWDPTLNDADRAAAEAQSEALQQEWQEAQADYRAALQETVRRGMKSCRSDPEVATYTWNATGLTLGVSPSFRNGANALGTLRPRGGVIYGTGAYGFDRQGTRPGYVPSFLGAHAQILIQVLYRLHEPLLNPLQPGTTADVNELVTSLRLRAGTSAWNGNIEGAVIHDKFATQPSDTLTKLSIGLDSHVAKGTWLSFSVGRTFGRDAIPNQTSGGISIKWSMLD